MTNRVQKTLDHAQHHVEDGVDAVQTAVSHQADQLIVGTQRAAAEAEASIQQGLRQVREAVPAHLARATHRAEDLARAGIDKARAAGSAVASKAQHLGECTTDYVREKPAKALLMAAAAGAATTLLVGWALRRRAD